VAGRPDLAARLRAQHDATHASGHEPGQGHAEVRDHRFAQGVALLVAIQGNRADAVGVFH
jgi:hypothetical protein